MEKAIIIKSIFLFICLWGFSLVFLWFRPRIEPFWKIIATLIYLFYIWFFFTEINAGYNAFMADWYNTLIHFLKEILSLVFVNLFFFWPVSLILIFYKANDMGAEKLLKFLCILTLILWIFFLIYVFYNKGIDSFLFQKLKEMVPGAK